MKLRGIEHLLDPSEYLHAREIVPHYAQCLHRLTFERKNPTLQEFCFFNISYRRSYVYENVLRPRDSE
jgi:hypothetical protein